MATLNAANPLVRKKTLDTNTKPTTTNPMVPVNSGAGYNQKLGTLNSGQEARLASQQAQLSGQKTAQQAMDERVADTAKALKSSTTINRYTPETLQQQQAQSDMNAKYDLDKSTGLKGVQPGTIDALQVNSAKRERSGALNSPLPTGPTGTVTAQPDQRGLSTEGQQKQLNYGQPTPSTTPTIVYGRTEKLNPSASAATPAIKVPRDPSSTSAQFESGLESPPTGNVPALSPEQYLALTPEQQAAYQQAAYQQQARNQFGMLDNVYGGAQNELLDQEAQILEQMKQAELEGDPTKDQEAQLALADLEAQKQAALKAQERALENQTENINESLAFSGFGRSTKRADLLADAAEASAANVADIERGYALGTSQVKAAMLAKVDAKVAKLEERLSKVQSDKTALQLQKAQAGFSLMKDLVAQDPSSPQSIMAAADKLQTVRLKEAELAQNEQKALRDDARANFQFMVTNFGSQYFNDMPEEALVNYASNLGMPVSALKNMGKTLKEQENAWDQLKYQTDRQDKFDMQQMQQEFTYSMNQLGYKQDLEKLGINFDYDLQKMYLGEQFKTAADQRKYSGLSYGNYAANATAPLENGAGLKMNDGSTVNSKLKDAYPPGYKKAPGTNGLGGQCAYEAGNMVMSPDGGARMNYGMNLQDKKNTLAKFAKKGQAFYAGQGQPQVGYSVITNESPQWGHVAVINEVKPDGSLVLSEFNRKGALAYTNNRVIKPNDPFVLGFIATKPNPTYQVSKTMEQLQKAAGEVKGASMAKAVLNMTSLGQWGNILGKAAGAGMDQQMLQGAARNTLPQTGEIENQMASGNVDENGMELTPDRQAVRSGALTLSQDDLSGLRQYQPEAYKQYMQDLTYSQNSKANKTDFTQANQLYNRYDSTSKEIRTLEQGNAILETFDVNTKNPYDDQALIFSFMKVLDPGSVVREGEFKTAQNNSSILNSVAAGWQNAATGTGMLTKEQRQKILNTMRTLGDQKKQQYGQLVQGYADTGAKLGFNDPSLFLDYTPEYFQQSQSSNNDPLGIGVGGGGGNDPLGIFN